MSQTIEEALYSTATGEATIAARIGTRLYPGQAPEGATLPLGVYQEAAQQSLRALASKVNLNRYSWHVDFYAASYAEAKAARNAFRDFFNRRNGNVGDGTLRVRGCYDETGDDGADAPIHADEYGVFRAGLDLTLYYGTN